MKMIPENLEEALRLAGFRVRKRDDPDTGVFYVGEMDSVHARSERECIDAIIKKMRDGLSRVDELVPKPSGGSLRITNAPFGNAGNVSIMSPPPSSIHTWNSWHTAGQPWRECITCGITQVLPASDSSKSDPEARTWVHPDEPAECVERKVDDT